MQPRLIYGEEARQKFDVIAENKRDVVTDPLYDYVVYPAAGSTEIIFFQNPKGQGGKTIQDTNMLNAGQLTTPQAFLVEALSVDFFPAKEAGESNVATAATNWNDQKAFREGDISLDFRISNKSYVQQAPMQKFPSSAGLAGGAALSGQITAATVELIDYATCRGNMFQIVPVLIESNVSFSVTIQSKALVPVTADTKIGVNLHGLYYRAVQ